VEKKAETEYRMVAITDPMLLAKHAFLPESETRM
jgi:hypothetical protein